MTQGSAAEQNEHDEGGAGGPGAPTPLAALVGMSGLTDRDVKLLIEGGFHTVEAIAYTSVSLCPTRCTYSDQITDPNEP